jgi:hypothetical protein
MANVWVLAHELHKEPPVLRVFQAGNDPKSLHPKNYRLVIQAALSLIYRILSDNYEGHPKAEEIKEQINQGNIGQVLYDFNTYFGDDHRISIQHLPIEYT